MKEKIDNQFDVLSFDEDGFTLSIDAPEDMIAVYIQYRKETWKE